MKKKKEKNNGISNSNEHKILPIFNFIFFKDYCPLDKCTEHPTKCLVPYPKTSRWVVTNSRMHLLFNPLSFGVMR